MAKTIIMAMAACLAATYALAAHHETISALRNDGLSHADTSRVYNLDEVVVVSQPKEVTSLRHQPLSSTVLTGRDMARLGIRSLSDISAYVPSFSMPAYGSRLTSSVYVRGIGSLDNNPAVGLYLDCLPLVSKNSYNFHTYQLDRTDVLRGPQGTLYGMNTEAGMARMYS